MQNVFRQFGAKDTGSFSRKFQRSLWKLTAIYVVILALILALSSSVIYSAFSTRLERRYRVIRPIPLEYVNAVSPPPASSEVKSDLVEAIYIVNSLLLIAAGLASYWLARMTLRPLQESYEEQRRFLADASHELRTPLSILKTELENERATAGSAREKVESKIEEVDRMTGIVSDLLALSRLSDTGSGVGVEMASVNIVSLAAEHVERLQSLARSRTVTLELKGLGADVRATTDADLLGRALSNILKNAIVYNKPHGTVGVTLSVEGDSVSIEVRDTGIGITPNDQGKVFDRFYRADTSRSRNTGGSGLGLSIVSSVVQRLGGTVHLTSEIDKGTTVTILIPRS